MTARVIGGATEHYNNKFLGRTNGQSHIKSILTDERIKLHYEMIAPPRNIGKYKIQLSPLTLYFG